MAEDSGPKPPPTDLLGAPYRPLKDRRGRRSNRYHEQDYEKVAVLRATGMEPPEIALAMKVSLPTLKKYFFRELAQGEVLKRAELYEAIMGHALKGRVGAMRLALELLERGGAAVPLGRRNEPPAPRPEKLGKKATLEEAAQTGHEGTEWGDLLH